MGRIPPNQFATLCRHALFDYPVVAPGRQSNSPNQAPPEHHRRLRSTAKLANTPLLQAPPNRHPPLSFRLNPSIYRGNPPATAEKEHANPRMQLAASRNQYATHGNRTAITRTHRPTRRKQPAASENEHAGPGKCSASDPNQPAAPGNHPATPRIPIAAPPNAKRQSITAAKWANRRYCSSFSSNALATGGRRLQPAGGICGAELQSDPRSAESRGDQTGRAASTTSTTSTASTAATPFQFRAPGPIHHPPIPINPPPPHPMTITSHSHYRAPFQQRSPSEPRAPKNTPGGVKRFLTPPSL